MFICFRATLTMNKFSIDRQFSLFNNDPYESINSKLYCVFVVCWYYSYCCYSKMYHQNFLVWWKKKMSHSTVVSKRNEHKRKPIIWYLCHISHSYLFVCPCSFCVRSISEWERDADYLSIHFLKLIKNKCFWFCGQIEFIASFIKTKPFPIIIKIPSRNT